MSRSIRAALLATVFLLSGCTADRSHIVLPPDGFALDSTGRTPRRFLTDSLELVAVVGGQSERDTTLLEPYLITAWNDRVYLVESDQRILAYDATGHRRWVQGTSGGGPGEYRNIRDLKFGPDHHLWIHDPVSARITRLDTLGAVAGLIQLQSVGHSETMVPGRDGGASLLPSYADADILHVDSTGVVVHRDTLRWDGYHALEVLSRGHRTAVDPVSGRWALGFEYGNGWFALDTNQGSGRRYYVEPTRFPPVIKEVRNGGQSIGTKLVRSEQSGIDLSLVGDTLFVLFGGKELRRQVLDLYGWGSGNYFGSLRLPERVEYAAVSGPYLYTLSSNPLPQLMVYRRVRAGAVVVR